MKNKNPVAVNLVLKTNHDAGRLMKSVLVLFVLISSQSVFASTQLVRGAEAQKLWDSLPDPIVRVHDEHGGADFAEAKYGQDLGCQRSLADGQVECWLQE